MDEEYIYEGMGLEVVKVGPYEVGFSAMVIDGNQHICGKEEAIAAARAILKHFGEE